MTFTVTLREDRRGLVYVGGITVHENAELDVWFKNYSAIMIMVKMTTMMMMRMRRRRMDDDDDDDHNSMSKWLRQERSDG